MFLIYKIILGYRMWKFFLEGSDCEELEGLLTGDDGVGFLVYNLKKLFSIYIWDSCPVY